MRGSATTAEAHLHGTFLLPSSLKRTSTAASSSLPSSTSSSSCNKTFQRSKFPITSCTTSNNSTITPQSLLLQVRPEIPHRHSAGTAGYNSVDSAIEKRVATAVSMHVYCGRASVSVLHICVCECVVCVCMLMRVLVCACVVCVHDLSREIYLILTLFFAPSSTLGVASIAPTACFANSANLLA